jgi:hypothetical protein
MRTVDSWFNELIEWFQRSNRFQSPETDQAMGYVRDVYFAGDPMWDDPGQLRAWIIGYVTMSDSIPDHPTLAERHYTALRCVMRRWHDLTTESAA